MSDLRTKTTDALLDRLAELEASLNTEPQAGQLIEPILMRVVTEMREVTLIHIELARRTATGWRPL